MISREYLHQCCQKHSSAAKGNFRMDSILLLLLTKPSFVDSDGQTNQESLKAYLEIESNSSSSWLLDHQLELSQHVSTHLRLDDYQLNQGQQGDDAVNLSAKLAGEFPASKFIILTKFICYPRSFKHFQGELYAQTAHFSSGYCSIVQSNFLDRDAS